MHARLLRLGCGADCVNDPVCALVSVIARDRDKRPDRRYRPANECELQDQAEYPLPNFAHREK
jgi:hypothetical protein